MTHLRLPSPAMVIACLALLVSLSGTAIAASPVVKRALFADNAGKVQGKTAAQLAALPSPSSSSAGLLSSKTQPDSLAPAGEREFVVGCDAGKKIVSGGFSSDGAVLAWDSRPMSDSTWGIFLTNVSTTRAAAVTLYAVCLG
jgi:hypothetical protein